MTAAAVMPVIVRLTSRDLVRVTNPVAADVPEILSADEIRKRAKALRRRRWLHRRNSAPTWIACTCCWGARSTANTRPYGHGGGGRRLTRRGSSNAPTVVPLVRPLWWPRNLHFNGLLFEPPPSPRLVEHEGVTSLI